MFTTEDLEILARQEQAFQRESLDSLQALEIGNAIVEAMKEYDRGISCQIVRESDGVVIFQYVNDDKTSKNFIYLDFKHQLVQRYNHSSAWVYVAAQVEDSGVDSDVKAAAGGFPIKNMEGKLIATIIVSGLHNGKDHEVIIKALETVTGQRVEYLEKEVI